VAPLRAHLLGPFSVRLGERSAGPWARPSAKRLCELVLLSPGRRISREAARQELFPNLVAQKASRELSKALSMARAALSNLGNPGAGLLQADRSHIWASGEAPLQVDLELHEERLRVALATEPGIQRDHHLVLALADERALLEGEPSAEWAFRPRERLEWARQEARLALARDRARGKGRSRPEAVIEAWEACLSHDPTCEEAASALVRVYAAQGRHALAASSYERCRAALEDLGLRASPALDEARAAATAPPGASRAAPEPFSGSEERRLVSVLFAELAGPVGTRLGLGPEDLRELVVGVLAEVVAQVERLGGTVTSVSGAGLVGLFGTPEAHEDDPERAVRAGFRVVSGAPAREGLSVRVGVETGEAVVGPIGGGSRAYYGAVGEVVGAAAALQSVARAGSVLVGPVTRAATEGLFDWGPTEEVAALPGARLVGTYLERPKARAARARAGRRTGGRAPLVGRAAELSVLQGALREATSGKGAGVLITGEPGLGKTRLVEECRNVFMAWVGAGSGRLPLWLEGHGASYASSSPYGLYRQLLSAWVGASPEEGEGVVRPALERAMKALFGQGTDNDDRLALLAQLMGLPPAPSASSARLSPERLQRAIFAAVRSVLSRLVANGPTVLVLEDLHWADPTSLRLTEELSSLTSEGPLLLVLTRRPEPDPGASALEASLSERLGPVLHKVELSPLHRADERHLAQALLGGGVPDEVLDALSESAEGNPLFLEERLLSLLETGALVRDETGWRLDQGVAGTVPEVLERLVRSRVDRLSAGPREVIVAASVLGAEFGLDALATVTDLDGELRPAVQELCAAGLLAQVRGTYEPTYRFRHALIQEATYKGLLRAQRRRLHARAAWGLEGASAGRAEEVAAVLGHHFAMAGEGERAVHFLEVAGDHATAAFANSEAVDSFRSALVIVDQDRRGSVAMARAAVALRAKLAEVLWRTARREEAREALREAVHLAGPSDSLQTARLHIRLGRLEVADYHYDAALAAFDAAKGLLGNHPEGQDEVWADQWLEAMVDGRALLHIGRKEPELALAALAAARPVVEAQGSPARKQAFYMLLAYQRASQDRWRVDEEDIANLRRALAAATQGRDEVDIAFAMRDIGQFLLLHGDLAEAREHLEKSLAMAERIGDISLRAQDLTWLVLSALRCHDVEAVRSLAPQAIAAGGTAAYADYVAVAKASLAWLAWQDQRPQDVTMLANEAAGLLGAAVEPDVIHLKWVYLWPLMAVQLGAGQVAEAVEAARQLLAPNQQRLPEALESLVQAVAAAWDEGEPELAEEKLGAAIDLAQCLRYA
jgi:adenylate cyclase